MSPLNKFSPKEDLSEQYRSTKFKQIGSEITRTDFSLEIILHIKVEPERGVKAARTISVFNDFILEEKAIKSEKGIK